MSARAVTGWALAALIGAPGSPANAQVTGGPVLSFDAAITEALDRGPVLSRNVDAVTLAEIRQRVAASAFATKITPSVMETTDPFAGDVRSAGLTVTKNLPTGGQVFINTSAFSIGDAGSAVRSVQYSVGITQPLLRGFRRTATADLVSADRAYVSASRELDNSRDALIVDVVRRYFAVIRAQRVAGAATAAAARAAALTAASRARTSVGLATELDVLRARLQESHVASAVTLAQTALAAAEDDLAVILGRPLSPSIAVDASLDLHALEARLTPVPDSIADLVAIALASRTDVVEAHDRVTDAERAVDVAKWNLTPPVSLDLSYSQRGLNVPGAMSLGPLAGGWHVGLSSTYSIDRSAGSAAVATARLASAAAERGAQATARDAETDVRRTYRSWQSAVATVDIERDAVQLAERELDLANMRLERGLGDTLDVVTAEGSLLEAQTALIGAELDRTIEAIDLRRALGVLHEGPWS